MATCKSQVEMALQRADDACTITELVSITGLRVPQIRGVLIHLKHNPRVVETEKNREIAYVWDEEYEEE